MGSNEAGGTSTDQMDAATLREERNALLAYAHNLEVELVSLNQIKGPEKEVDQLVQTATNIVASLESTAKDHRGPSDVLSQARDLAQLATEQKVRLCCVHSPEKSKGLPNASQARIHQLCNRLKRFETGETSNVGPLTCSSSHCPGIPPPSPPCFAPAALQAEAKKSVSFQDQQGAAGGFPGNEREDFFRAMGISEEILREAQTEADGSASSELVSVAEALSEGLKSAMYSSLDLVYRLKRSTSVVANALQGGRAGDSEEDIDANNEQDEAFIRECGVLEGLSWLCQVLEELRPLAEDLTEQATQAVSAVVVFIGTAANYSENRVTWREKLWSALQQPIPQQKR